jgi:hypothetical protein
VKKKYLAKVLGIYVLVPFKYQSEVMFKRWMFREKCQFGVTILAFGVTILKTERGRGSV